MKKITDIYEASLSSNKLDESSILGDLDDTLDYGDKYADIYNFINWWIGSAIDVNEGTVDPNYDRNDIIKRLLNIVSHKNGEFTIDIKTANKDNILFDVFEYTAIYLSKKIGIPSNVKTINFINVGNNYSVELFSQISDMSKLKITCTGKGNIGLNVKIRPNTYEKITLPVINTQSALIIARTVSSITFPKGTDIKDLDLSNCFKLTDLNGDLSVINNFTTPKYFASETIKKSLNLSQKSKVQVA